MIFNYLSIDCSFFLSRRVLLGDIFISCCPCFFEKHTCAMYSLYWLICNRTFISSRETSLQTIERMIYTYYNDVPVGNKTHKPQTTLL